MENEAELTGRLRIELLRQQVPIYDNFNDFPLTRKIQALRSVMGLNSKDLANHNPDLTYELTMDNCLKLMAIFLRLKCDLPMIIMGETGCGKTRMLKFFSDLHVNPKCEKFKHLIHFKIHGGVNYNDIKHKVEEAEKLSRDNHRKLYPNGLPVVVQGRKQHLPATAILFLDEANTTEAIGLIKEILCDRTCNGCKISFEFGLKIVAAINPYRKHEPAMIKKLEEAGLGFFMSASDSKEKFGHLPMRHLVYRVQPLPSSLVPFIWDFGQLDQNTERIYIKQMLSKAVKNGTLSAEVDKAESDFLSELLSECQKFMRTQSDECSFVSLRDIERALRVAGWFTSKKNLILSRMNTKSYKIMHIVTDFDAHQAKLSETRRAFNLALSVCYHASLQSQSRRYNFRELIGKKLLPNVQYSAANDWVLAEILMCQHIFLDEVQLANNIARNSALLENVFMIIVCLELRIPLFIVGKPGSSKSLAKTIVSNSMQGNNSKSELFKNLKETYFINFQCSPLTKPEMIIHAFKEAASFQEGKDLDKSVSIVNLDEIGLAEGSESMPLKTLHPLLEEGTDSSECVGKPHQKVGFIGISNWSLGKFFLLFENF